MISLGDGPDRLPVERLLAD